MTKIDLDRYVSEDRKAEIAEAVFREHCETVFRQDAERIFSNAAYRAVWAAVDEMFDGNAAEMVAAKIPKIIDGMSEYGVFRAKGIYDKEESPGHAALAKAIKQNEGLIADRVASLIGEITREEIVDTFMHGDVAFRVSIDRHGK